RSGGRKVRILIASGDRRQCEFVTQAVIENQVSRDSPVVLRVESVVTVNLSQVANGLGGAGVTVTEEEGRKRTPAGCRSGAGDCRFQETEARLAGDVLLAETVGFLLVISEAELERVGSANHAEVVFKRPSRLLGAIVRRASPTRKFREGDISQV